MKRFVLLGLFLVFYHSVFAQNEIGPEGQNLIWLLLIVLGTGIIFFIFSREKWRKSSIKKSLFQRKKVKIKLEKDRLYYPDNLKLTIKNSGNADIDLDRPLMVFDNFWLKRKFRLNGMENRLFYPLYLEKGKVHTLDIDLYRFYGHDKSLKKFPKLKITISEVNGKRLGSRTIFLRKTLLKF